MHHFASGAKIKWTMIIIHIFNIVIHLGPWNFLLAKFTGNLEYSPERGAAIDAHFDDFWLWGERLITVNMLSGTWLSMTCQERPEVVIHVPMPRRSLIAVYSEARCVYHSSFCYPTTLHCKHKQWNLWIEYVLLSAVYDNKKFFSQFYRLF